MRNNFSVIVVIPVGPGTNPDFLIDTIESYIFYSTSSCKIIINDDSHQGIGAIAQSQYPEIDVLYSKSIGGHMAGLYITLAEAYRYAIEKYKFELLFKLDTDALIIAEGPEEAALELFEQNPAMGMAGQYPLDYSGKIWDMSWPRDRIVNGTMTWKYIKRPFANILLRKLHLRALRHNYRTGESVFGGAYFMSYAFLESLAMNNLLPNYSMRSLNLGEDHLFSLLARAQGFELGDLASGSLPFACAWKGLPDSPATLLQKNKKIIHSTRGWSDMKEEDIRAFYHLKRTGRLVANMKNN